MNVYEVITDRILKQLESGTVPWHKPWSSVSSMPKSLATRKPYRGVNAFMLSMADYDSPYWLTYSLASKLKCPVKAGEKGWPVVFWKFLDRKDPEAESISDEDVESGHRRGGKIPLLRYYTVFNTAQCKGMEAFLTPTKPEREVKPIIACQAVIDGLPSDSASIRHDSSKACYIPSTDTIRMPKAKDFDTDEAYYGTLFHELIHSTGHATRLNRVGITHGLAGIQTTDLYAREELIAEMGAAFLCGHCGIDTAPISENHAAYLAHWIKRLTNDPKLIVQAAAAGQKAADLILGIKPEYVSESQPETANA